MRQETADWTYDCNPIYSGSAKVSCILLHYYRPDICVIADASLTVSLPSRYRRHRRPPPPRSRLHPLQRPTALAPSPATSGPDSPLLIPSHARTVPTLLMPFPRLITSARLLRPCGAITLCIRRRGSAAPRTERVRRLAQDLERVWGVRGRRGTPSLSVG